MLSIKVPPLGESIVEATVSRWLKKEGDAVATGDTVVELDTDKITVEVPALKAGVLAKQSHKEGDVVHVDDVLGEIDETAVAASGASSGATAQVAAGVPASPASPRPISEPAKNKSGGLGGAAGAGSADTPTAPRQSDQTKSSPAARRIADERGIDIAAVAGTGRGGVVSKPDVLAATSAPARTTSPISPPMRGGNGAAPGERETREKMSTRRKRIAENLLQSQHATAHLTTFNEVDMSALNALRDKYKERVEKERGVKLTFMPFFVRAACQALKQFPT
ncbi:MAG TPA: 2-oxo acid dehydrogenase subunit E2, partial [Gemmatimonadaceae bacterium]|nr:2-oxo acid dehydrogenase subunit E2 [Gemmatimonadaceae bacterium]